MIDSHCHLTDPRLLGQIDAVLARAKSAGISRMVTVGTEIEDAQAAIELCEKFPQLRCAAGIHPNYCHEAQLEDIPRLAELQKHPKVAAVGEMGLDYHYTYAPLDRQRQFFESQLQIAVQYNRNIIIHCREAVEDALQILKGFPNLVVFHCFTGSIANAEAILAAGYWISYTGVITFKKNDALRECVRLTPRDRLMVETDAPYLSPEPLRSQKINEPSLVIHTAATVAREWGVSIDELDKITTANADRFFGTW